MQRCRVDGVFGWSLLLLKQRVESWITCFLRQRDRKREDKYSKVEKAGWAVWILVSENKVLEYSQVLETQWWAGWGWRDWNPIAKA